MRPFKIYLAGKMSGLTFEEMNGWRAEATWLLNEVLESNIKVISPCLYYNFDMDSSTYTEKEVRDFDLYQVKTSNVILVNLNFSDSVGTAIELHMAGNEWDVPVVAFRSKSRKSHPWIDLSVTKMCESLEEAVQYIKDFYYSAW